MKKIFEKYGIKLTEKQEKAFESYYETLIEYNKMFNLTTITQKEEVYVKHFVDSALVINNLKSGALIDVGSGGGFPAIPIKILREDIDVTMLEATGKKCEFLSEVINRLNLSGIKVINGRAEELAKTENHREKYDYCTARAVARLNTLCEYCMPFVKVGGEFVSLKGDAEEETIEAQNAIKILGGKLKEKKDYLLEDAKRSLIIIEKIKNTDKKYPRGQGKERKKPL